MTDYVLSKSFRATFDANNVARILNVGPGMARESWEIRYTSVATTSDDETELRIYRNASLTQQVEGTVKGNLDTSDTVFKLRTGEKLYYVFTGGQPGTFADVTIEGIYTIPGNRGGGIE